MADDAHQPVLLNEAVAGLNIKKEGIYIDGTFGRGGHASAVLAQLGPKGRLLAMDKDPEAVSVAHQKFADDDRFAIEQGSFALLDRIVAQRGWLGRVDGVLLDLGVSSPQLDSAQRGFSFLKDGPLDMRMDNSSGQSAAQWLARAGAGEIATVLKTYGEERFAKRIARAICDARSSTPITTTSALAKIISDANPSWEQGKHPATRSFQAIRIFINRELDDLRVCLDTLYKILAPGGRLAVISFHSLEDRMIKRFIRSQEQRDDIPAGLPVTHDQMPPRMRAVGKAVHAAQEEVAENPRARSAVLRIAEKVA